MQYEQTGRNVIKLNIDDDKFTVVDSVLIKSKDFYSSEIYIPKGVIDLGEYSIGSIRVEFLYIPLSVKIIRRNSLLYLSNLTKIYIENPEIYLEAGCFNILKNLKEIYIGGQRVDTVVTQKDRDWENVFLERYVGKDKSYRIDNDINVIGKSAFCNCKSLESVEFSQSVKQISMSAFCGCDSLKEIVLTDSLRDIFGCAFENCTGVKELTIPRSVNYLGVEVFKGWRRNQIIRVPMHFKKLRILQKWRRGCRAEIIYY